MSENKRKRKYSKALKEEAVRLFLDEKRTRREIAIQLGVRDRDCVKEWVQIFRREGKEGFSKPVGRPKKGKSDGNIENRIRYLEMENELLRNFLYEVGRK